jgi:hypothetical protein
VTDAAIIEAEYVEWKMVKTRKALQLIFEVPLEKQALVQAALGTPMPDTSTPVAIARLNLAAITTTPEPEQIEPPRRTAKLSQIAGILCNEGAFRKFIRVETVDQAAEYIRNHCRVSSRANIDGNPDATAAFNTLKGEYELWLRCEAA